MKIRNASPPPTSRYRDDYSNVQNLRAVALTGLTAAINMLNGNAVDEDILLERICDAAKLIADVQHKITESRRAYILPLLEDKVRLALADSVPGKLLF